MCVFVCMCGKLVKQIRGDDPLDLCNDDEGPKKLATLKTRPTLFAVQLQMARANTQSKRRKQFTTTATRLREYKLDE